MDDLRGSYKDRAARKKWMLKTFGNGKTVKCVHCGKKLNYGTLTADRILPGCRGGRYIHGNIQPSCDFCNKSRGAKECGYVSMAQEVDDYLKSNPRRRRHNPAKRIKSKVRIYRKRAR